MGKTVLLRRMADDAERAEIRPIRVETPEDRSLPSVLAPHLRTALERLKGQSESRAQQLAARALRGLAGFLRALEVKYKDIEISLADPPEAGLADNRSRYLFSTSFFVGPCVAATGAMADHSMNGANAGPVQRWPPS